ncbi:pentatricopeptide repeat-containing protein [Trifolium medium]|uniref:Pentatricopeptide repeat-containing protein n=1 Tax=Trifolium medium TaxID=97028 RepID=A0A392NSC8_9FABA|nr:pentatricopeptide repeat-containing protein [Trifolium medium]
MHYTRRDRWNSLWKIHAPPKTKHLLWRICKNCLHTRSRLQERCVPCPMECPLCRDSIETTKAAGLEQTVAGRVLHMRAADEVIMDICRTENKEVARRYAMLVWILWNNRNRKVWNGEQEAGRYLGEEAPQFWQDWHTVQAMQQDTHNHGQQQLITQW